MKTKKTELAQEPTVSPDVSKSSMTSANTSTIFPIVGIGASAGGLEAYEQFFFHAPNDSGMAFVLVSHLDPDHASLLTEILQRSTSMPVVEATDQQLVAPNCVYVIPPNRDMAIFHGKLQLSQLVVPCGLRMPIDVFLRSLAEDRQDKAIGIILSGTGTDGTLGLRAILGAGGFTLAQEPATAKFDSMPSSAINAGYVLHVLPAEKMAEALLTVLSSKAPFSFEATSGINRILMQLRTITGHDFSQYKKSTIQRRIERRMLRHNIESTEVYARYLKENPAEARTLFKELLINVTSFFRDTEAFALLQKDILPQLCKNKTDDYVFRIWIAGCATGEEAYSIAILLRELMDETSQAFKVQIYATDLDENAIAIARAGVYPLNIAQDIALERLRRFFVREGAGYRVKKEIREMVVFAVQSLVKDPPFTRLDLLSCRNLLIYLMPELQKRLIPMFHHALKPGGVLFLSPSESIGNHTELFSSLSHKWKFYRAIHADLPVRTEAAHVFSLSRETGGKVLQEVMKNTPQTSFSELARRMLAQYFVPASVVTDLEGVILYVHGDTGKYLRPAPGQASLNVIDMAREGLELELAVAIRTAVNEGISTLNREIRVKTNGGFTAVSLSVRPLPAEDGGRKLLLASFQDVAIPAAAGRKRVAKSAEAERIAALESELAYMKESQHASIAEQQASNEDFRSANEEMQSTNEELQSTNEELETSQEELQSVNEELITVNSELQAKIGQLVSMQNDMKNLLDNINVGIIFLDRRLLIRSFTREATRVYRLVPSDEGRSLSDIKMVEEGDDLLLAARTVLDSLIPYECEIHLGNDVWMLARILPYRTLDNMIDGVVMTFTDITSRIKAVAVQDALMLAEGIVNTTHEPFIVLDGTLRVVSANHAFCRKLQVAREAIVGRMIDELGGGQWNIPALLELLKTVLSSEKSLEDYVMEYDFPIIGQRKMVLNAHRVVGLIGEPQFILLSMEVKS
jgi:two-component system CheB/CheR fusion protein